MGGEKISIIVPIYKVENVLERCIDSLVGQTYKNIEIILVDDGSPDKCGEICDEYAKQDSRVVVIHKENGGLSSARNEGIKRTSGEYVMFVDSDDYIESTTCEKLSCYFTDYPDIIMGDCVTVNKGYGVFHYDGFEEGKIMSGKEYLHIALERKVFPVVVWLNMYKSEFLKSNDLYFPEGRLHEDLQFTPRALYSASKIVYSNCKFYHYITHEGSISSAKDKRKNCSDIYMTCIELENMITNEKEKRMKKLLNDFLCNCYLGIFRAGNLYNEGKKYVHKKYVLNNAYDLKTKIKAILFITSPKLFCRIKRNG